MAGEAPFTSREVSLTLPGAGPQCVPLAISKPCRDLPCEEMKSVYRKFRRMFRDSLLKRGLVHLETAVRAEIELAQKTSVASKTGQLGLVQTWRSQLHRKEPLPCFRDVEFRAFSQNGEDGILLYIFSLIGPKNKICVEICAGDGIQCNSANLILNHGWTGLLIDGNEKLVQRGKAFYSNHPDTFSFPPKFAHAWIDRETVNALIAGHGIEGEIDLLSIDLDGVDYWVWEAVEVISPRVVVAETQCIWGAERSVSVPYRRDFKSPLIRGFGVYSGASLPAFVRLARRKGYRLVGTQALGFNAFFVRNDIGVDVLPEASAAVCLDHPFVHWASRELLPLVRDKEWVDV